jgi:hypothetical protein
MRAAIDSHWWNAGVFLFCALVCGRHAIASPVSILITPNKQEQRGPSLSQSFGAAPSFPYFAAILKQISGGGTIAVWVKMSVFFYFLEKKDMDITMGRTSCSGQRYKAKKRRVRKRLR